MNKEFIKDLVTFTAKWPDEVKELINNSIKVGSFSVSPVKKVDFNTEKLQVSLANLDQYNLLTMKEWDYLYHSRDLFLSQHCSYKDSISGAVYKILILFPDDYPTDDYYIYVDNYPDLVFPESVIQHFINRGALVLKHSSAVSSNYWTKESYEMVILDSRITFKTPENTHKRLTAITVR